MVLAPIFTGLTAKPDIEETENWDLSVPEEKGGWTFEVQLYLGEISPLKMVVRIGDFLILITIVLVVLIVMVSLFRQDRYAWCCWD